MTTIFGTSGADTITSGSGADVISAGAGNDIINWRNGGSDVIDGGDGADILNLTESTNSRSISVSGAAGHTLVSDSTPDTGGPVVQVVAPPNPIPVPTANLNVTHVEQLNIAIAPATPFSVTDLVDSDLTNLKVSIGRFAPNGTVETVHVNAGDAGETLSVLGSGVTDASVQETLGARTVTTHISSLVHGDTVAVSGGAGDDVISAAQAFGRTAESSALSLSGGGGNDFIGLNGWVTAHGDAGDDSFQWIKNAGHDTIDGGTGYDALDVVADFVGQGIKLSSVGGQLQVDGIGIDVGIHASNLEEVVVATQTQGGTFIVGNLAGSGVQHVDINLGPGLFGQNALDTVVVTGTAGADSISFVSNNEDVIISGLPEGLAVNGIIGSDSLSVVAGDGDDFIQGAGIATSARVDLLGGAGNDTIIGGASSTHLAGEDGFDVLSGSGGFGTIFEFNVANSGFDKVTNFRASGPNVDIIELDGGGFKNTTDFHAFVLHNLVSDGHGGAEIVADNGVLIADILGVTLNQFSQANFLFS